MSDFLSNLITRSFADQPAIRPRLPSLFESAAAAPFAEVQWLAPMTTAAQTSPPAISSASKSFATGPSGTEESTANATVGLSAEKPPSQISEPATPLRPATVSSPRSGEKRAAEFEPKKSVVPITAALDGKNQGHTAKAPLFQASSERSPFQARRQNSFSPVETRASAPAIHVTIGRVEVRAIQSAAPLPKPAKPKPPKLSLEDYLQKRDGGAR
jgi:hypothetical protein